MLKKILSILSVVVLAGYLVYSVLAMTDRHEDSRLCRGVDLHITDSLHFDLIDEEMVLAVLQEHSIDPVGMPLEEIEPEKIEATLLMHPLVGKVQCYKTGGDMLRINLSSKVPLVRVINNRGQDSAGELLEVVRVIDRSEFWKAQVEQINVTKDGQIELVPRVGDHLLILGTAQDVENKLQRLMNFYEKGLDNVGWNKYRSISVAYENQVVCKKRK